MVFKLSRTIDAVELRFPWTASTAPPSSRPTPSSLSATCCTGRSRSSSTRRLALGRQKFDGYFRPASPPTAIERSYHGAPLVNAIAGGGADRVPRPVAGRPRSPHASLAKGGRGRVAGLQPVVTSTRKRSLRRPRAQGCRSRSIVGRARRRCRRSRWCATSAVAASGLRSCDQRAGSPEAAGLSRDINASRTEARRLLKPVSRT